MKEPAFAPGEPAASPPLDPAHLHGSPASPWTVFLSEMPDILDMLPVGLHIEDNNFRSIFVNESFVRIFGYTLAEIASPDDWWRLAYPDPQYREMVQRHWSEALAFATANDCEINPQE
jgi:PAS domain-containing protein